jgi:hypothetical protein
MVEIDSESDRGARETWEQLMEKTKNIRDRIWGESEIPEGNDGNSR